MVVTLWLEKEESDGAKEERKRKRSWRLGLTDYHSGRDKVCIQICVRS